MSDLDKSALVGTQSTRRAHPGSDQDGVPSVGGHGPGRPGPAYTLGSRPATQSKEVMSGALVGYAQRTYLASFISFTKVVNVTLAVIMLFT